MKKIDRLTVSYHDIQVGILTMSPDGRLCRFEYDREWIGSGFSISPLELPLRHGVFEAQPTPFAGNFGIFRDSLPDGYGHYLLRKALRRAGIDDTRLSTLDRLSIVGKSGMGALTYAPLNNIIVDRPSDDFDMLQAKALEVLTERQDDDAKLLLYNSNNSGGARPKTIFADKDGHWLIKFRHVYDPQDIGQQEYIYTMMARACGIEVPDCRLINERYFATRRFDIDKNGQRVHCATAGALLCLSLSQPLLDYSNLLALTGYLTQNPHDVEQMFRRMIFNYQIGNKDDHCKNFTFYVKQDVNGLWRWRLAPAYDLTESAEGYNGEHATSVNGTGRPSSDDFIAVGTRFRIPLKRCRQLIEEVCDKCRRF